MLPSSGDVKILDVSRLTDDEAKHVWQVIQRDLNLRKKEEDRLGELKTKIMKEDTKKELLEYQPKLSDSLCIRCLHPFKFLVNSKRHCLDCKLFVCKSCSRFNKKECGWVCDACHMARIHKIGTLEWFHENVRSRFKRFGSVKVMNLLLKRLNCDRTCSQTDLREPQDDDTHSMPEVHTGSLYSLDDEQFKRADRQHFNLTRKAKRLLPVDPLDFNLGVEKSDYSQPDFFMNAGSQEKITQSRGSLTEESCTITFKHILENGIHGRNNDMLQISQRSLDRHSRFDDYTHTEQRMSQPRSLSKTSISSAGSTNYYLHRELSYSPDDSDEDSALQREPSPDDVPQIIELTKRISAIETFLSRLEQNMLSSVSEGTTKQAEQHEEDLSDLEELELRKKLDELADKISDKGVSSDEDDAIKSEDYSEKLALYSSTITCGSSTELRPVRHNWPVETEEWKVKPDVDKSFEKQRRLSPFDLCNTSSCELSQLEGKVAMAAASVQSTQSGVTDIQKRMAALSAAGMTEATSRRRASLQPSKVLHEFPRRASTETRPFRKLSIM